MLNGYDIGELLFNNTRRITVLEEGRVIPVTSYDDLIVVKSLNLRYSTKNTVAFIDNDKYVTSKSLSALIIDTPNQTTISQNADGSINVHTPQDLASISSPTFSGLILLGDLTTTGNVDGVKISQFYSNYNNHVNNSTTAHFGQDLKISASPHFYDLNISNNINVLGTVDGVDISVLNTNFLSHKNDATIHFTEASIDHTHIQNIGLNTHAEIDSHIANSTTAHFGQDLKSTAEPTFNQLHVTVEPTEQEHVASKQYVDAFIQGISWQPSVKEVYDPTSGLPPTPVTGDRYISYLTANGWTKDYIYEWNGSAWVETIPQLNYAVWVEGGGINPTVTLVYNDVEWVRFGSTMDHQLLIGAGVNTHAQIDSHIADTSIHFTESSIDHTHIQNIGTNTHAQIDSHIVNSTTAHFGQDLKSTAHPTFDQVTITAQPVADTDTANKSYVDTVIQTVDWQKSIISFYDPSSGTPESPSIGDRYVSTATAFGWTINRIYEWIGSWKETIPNIGFSIYVEGGSTYPQLSVLFNGSIWVPFGDSIDHTSLKNIGTNTHVQIDSHIADTSIHFTEASIQHQNIAGHGSYTHASIDNHITNSTDAHFGQDLTVNGTPEFASVIVEAQPTYSYELANKAYVDSIAQGLNWQKAVKEYYDPTGGLPVDPVLGDRYLCYATANGWIKDSIYEWDGIDTWVRTIPSSGFAVFIDGGTIDPNTLMVYSVTSGWVIFASAIDHNSLLNIGTHTHAQIDTHIEDASIHFTEASIDHTHIQNIGTNTHAQIDSHIADSTTAHFGQDLKSTGSPTFANVNISNDPTLDDHAIRKSYYDSQVRTSAWLKQVNAIYYPTDGLPVDPLTDDRYISSSTANGWFINRIYEWNGTAWVEVLPVEGMTAWVLGGTQHNEKYVHYLDSAWTEISDIIDHTQILNRGTYTHITIDSHLDNTTTAHFGQDLKNTATPTFAQVNVSIPTASTHCTTKSYVDGLIESLDWQKSVRSFFDPTSGLPADPTTGDRYISSATANTWIENMIYEYSGSVWEETIPNSGYTVWVESGSLYSEETVIYVGGITGWAAFGTTINHTDLKNIGTNTHADIDSHISNSTTAHFGQDLKLTGTPTFATLSLASTTDASDITTGSLTISGGVGIAKKLYVGTDLNANTITSTTSISGATGSITSTTDASDITTGALTVAGGVGIVKNLYVGGNLDVAGNLEYETASIVSTIDASDTQTGALQVAGGASIQKKLYVGTDLSANTITSTTSITGATGIITSTTDSSDITTGSLTIAGGLGVTKKLYVGTDLSANTISSTTSITGATGSITSTIDASDITTGALQVAGGVSIQKNVIIGETVQILSTNDSQDMNSGALLVSGGTGITGNLSVGGNTYMNGIITATDGTLTTLTIESTVNSSSSLNGALVITGGAGIGKNLHIGGDLEAKETIVSTINITSTVESTDTQTGVLKIAGGVGIAKNLYVGGSINSSSSITGNSITTESQMITGTTESTSTSTGILQVVGGVGISKNVNIGGDVRCVNGIISSTINSTSTNTGALLVVGGVGIGDNVNIGGNTEITGTLSAGDCTLSTLYVTSTLNATNTFSGAFYVSGGIGVAKDIYVGGNATITNTTTLSTLINTNTTDSTSTSTGSVRLTGGIGIAKNIHVGGLSTLNDVIIGNTTESTSTSTGSLQISGGTSIIKNLNVGGDVSSIGVIYALNTTDSTDSTTGSLVVSGGTGITKNLNVSGTTYVQELHVLSTTDSTDTQTGSLQISGGTGITKDLRVGGMIHSMSTIDATSYSSGSLIVDGGLGVAKNVFVAGNVSAIEGIFSTAQITSTVDSTDTQTGSLVIAGGSGISKDLHVGGSLHVANSVSYQSSVIVATTQSTDQYTGSVRVAGGAGIARNMNIGEDLQVFGTSTLDTLSVINTANATDTQTGVVQIAGGMSIAKDVYADGTSNMKLLTVYSTTNASDSLTGAVKVTGGMSIQKDLYVGTNTNLTTLEVIDTTDSTSTSTGSVQISGGVGVGKNLYVGAQLECPTQIISSTIDASDSITGVLQVAGGASVAKKLYIGDSASIPIVYVTNTVNATDTQTGALQIVGGMSITKDIYADGTSNMKLLNVYSTVDATDFLTGAVQIAGGIGVQKSIHVGTNANIVDTLTSNLIVATSTIESSSNSTGALVINGGVGIVKNANIGGNVNINGTLNQNNTLNVLLTTNSSDATTGSVILSGGMGVAKSIFIGEDLDVAYDSFVGTQTIRNTADSTDTQTGVLQIAGGASVAKNFYVGGSGGVNNMHVMSTTNATNTQTGSLLVSGGLGIAKDLYADNITSVNSGTFATITITSTVDSTDTLSGAVHIAGGVSIGKNLNVGVSSVTELLTIENTNDSTSVDTGSVHVHGGVGIQKNLTCTSELISGTTDATSTSTGILLISGGVGIQKTLVAQNVQVISTTDATSTSTGAMLISGGLGISKTLVAQNAQISSTIESSDDTTGALIISGGVGIAKDVRVKGRTHSDGVTTTDTIFKNATNQATLQPSASMAVNYSLTLPTGLSANPISALVADASGNFSWNNQMFTSNNVKVVSMTPKIGEFASIEAAIAACTSPSITNRYRIIIEAGYYHENVLEVPSYVFITGVCEESVYVSTNGDHDLFHLSSNTSIYQMVIEYVPQVAITASNTGITEYDYIEISKTLINYCGTAIYAQASTTSNSVYLENVDIYSPTVVGILLDSSPDYYNFVNLLSVSVQTYTGDGNVSIECRQGAWLVANTVIFYGNGDPAYGTALVVKDDATVVAGGITMDGFEKAIYCPTGTLAPHIEVSAGNMTNNTQEIVIENDNVTGYYFGITNRTVDVIPDAAPFYIYNTYPTMIQVSTKGGDFTSVKAAVESITDASASKQYIIRVYPGTYTEDSFSTKDYVHIQGIGAPLGTILVPSTSGSHFITHASNSTILNVTLDGNLGSEDYALIYCPGSTGTFESYVTSCQVQNTPVCFIQDTSIGDSTMILKSTTLGYNGVMKSSLRLSSTLGRNAKCVIDTSYKHITGTVVTDLYSVTGATSTLILKNMTLENESQVGNFVSVSDGANLQISNVTASGFDNCIYIPNVGSAPTINVDITIQTTGTHDIDILNANATGVISGSMTLSKINCLANDITFRILQSFGTILTGDFYFGPDINTVANMAPSIKYATNFGILTGGTHSESGLDVTVTAGTGYLTTGTIPTDTISLITWTEQTITVSANSYAYIYINSSGTLSQNASRPNYYNNVIICAVYSGDSTIIYTQNIDSDPHYTSSVNEFTLRDAMGPIVASGLITTENATLMHLDVTSGNYYYGNNKLTASSGTNITFYTFYRNGSGGWTRETANAVLARYDNNSGTLQTPTSGYYVKHALYANTNSTGTTTYLLVFSQQQFSSAAAAQEGNMPTPPTCFTETVTSIAGVVVQYVFLGTDNINSIVDARPTIGFKSGSQTATTDHNSLSNLTVGDAHPQYFRTDGTRAMTGDINANSNDVINLGNLINASLDSVNVFSHASRHLPNGTDPLPVDTPVSVGTTNAEGIVQKFARSDHVHAHGVQSDGTLHAVVTGSVNGFMSTTDKTKLDNATSSNTVSTLVLRSAAGDANFGSVTCESTAESTSTSTGSLKVAGGVGLAKALYVNDVHIVSTVSSTSTSTGSLIIAGGLGLGDNAYINGLLQTGTCAIVSTDEATSTSTGVLIISGGIGVAKNLHVGGTLDVFNGTFDTTNIISTVDSTDILTGAAVVSGGVGISKSLHVGGTTTSDVTTTNTLNILSTIDATNTQTGVVQVAGGISIAKNAYIGGSINSVGASSTTITVTSTIDSSDTQTGVLVISGGVSIAKKLYVGTDLYSNTISINSTDNSTSTSTGALIISGGVGIKSDVNVGGTLSASNVDFVDIIVSSTVDASDTQTGSLQVAGGASIVKNIHVGLGVTTGTINVVNTNDATDTQTGSLQIAGGASISKNLYVGGNDCVLNNVQVNSTVNATSTTTGSLQVLGGVGIAKDVHIGGITNIIPTDDATSISTGALIISGGLGITKKLYAGSNLITTLTTDSSDTQTGSVQIAGGLGVAKNISTSTEFILSTEDATSTSTGVLIISGGVGIAKNLYVGGLINAGNGTTTNLTVTSTETSTSTQTGSVQIAGGVGIAKDVYVGGVSNLVLTTDATSSSTGSLLISGGVGITKSVYVGGNLHLTSTVDASDITTGVLLISGGVGIAKKLYLGSSLYGNDLHGTTMNLTSTIESTDISTGSVIISGGVGIAKSLYVGNLFSSGDSSVSSLSVISTTNATSTNSGSIKIAGGLGVVKDAFIGGSLNNILTTESSDITTGATIIAGGVGIAKSVFIGSKLHVVSTDESTYINTGVVLVSGGIGVAKNISTNTCKVFSTVDASDITTGSLNISGGVGIAKNIYVGGTEYLVLTTDATSSTTGSLIISGGVGIAKNVQIGGNEYVLSTIDSSNITTGALQISGGVGIAKNTYIGGSLTSGAGTMPTLSITSTTDASATNTGVVQIAGGIGIAKNTYIGGSLTSGAGTMPTLSITSTTDASATNTGVVQIAGGVGIAKNTYITGTLNIQNTTESTNNTTGAVVISGGLGVVKNLQITGIINEANTTESTNITTGSVVLAGGLGIAKTLFGTTGKFVNTEDATDTTTGVLVISGGVGIAKTLHCNAGVVNTTLKVDTLEQTLSGITFNASTIVHINNTTESIATDVGSLTVAGGMGVQKTIYCNAVKTLGTTDSSSVLTGIVQIAGGVGISKNAYIGGIVGITLTTEATNITTGALQIAGGVGIAKSLYATTVVPTNLTMTNTVTSISTDTTLAANSDSILSTQRALKTYIDNKYAHVWLISDQKASGTAGGTATTGAWITRTLNNISGDTTDTSVTIAGNQITLTAGRYFIDAMSSSYYTNSTRLRIANITDAVYYNGASVVSLLNNAGCNVHAYAYLDITDTKVVEIQMRVARTQTTNGLGLACTFGDNEVYTQVKVTKLNQLN